MNRGKSQNKWKETNTENMDWPNANAKLSRTVYSYINMKNESSKKKRAEA